MKRLLMAGTLAAALPLASILPSSALAAQYNTVLPDESSVHFHYQQMGVGMDGEFTRFNGELNFDSDNPAAAKAAFDVDLSSVDTGTSDGDEEIVKKDWFDVDSHPVARFESTDIAVVEEGKFDVTGTLSLKGKTQTVTIPATFTASGDTGVFEGRFTLKRGDFAVGEGTWSAFDIVANEVDVSFRITASANE